MKKILILILAMLIFSGCVSQNQSGQNNTKTVQVGDNVSVDYTGTLNGKVFDTSIESVAKENNLSSPIRHYEPIRFVVGKGFMVKGFEEGIIGMKVGESKTLTIPPEKGYGQKNPQLIQTVPIIQNFPIIRNFSKTVDVPTNQFDGIFGSGRRIGENVHIPESNANLTILNISSSYVHVAYNLKVGDEAIGLAPWNETVIKIDDHNITTKSNAKKDDIVQLKGAVWNTTVIDIGSDNLTLRHNKIPDTQMRAGFGSLNVHFNETHIILDANNKLAGQTLIFEVTIRSINRNNTEISK